MITFTSFIKGLEKEYDCGVYSQLQTDLIGKFLEDNNISYLIAAEKILGFHSKSYKSLPDYAMFRKCFESEIKTQLEFEAVTMYATLERKSNRYNSIAIKGTRFINALDRIGGWMYFCDRTVQEAPFMKEKFIKAYIASEGGDEVKKYSGDLDTADNNMILLGCTREDVLQIENNKTPLQIAADKIGITFNQQEQSELREAAERDSF
jgi:hypothetical protein